MLLETRIDRIDTLHYAFKNEQVEEADILGMGYYRSRGKGVRRAWQV